MRILFSLEPECAHPWRVDYQGFVVPGYTASTALLQETRQDILGHRALTYEHLIAGITTDLPLTDLHELPELVFSDTIGESLRHATREKLAAVLSEKVVREPFQA